MGLRNWIKAIREYPAKCEEVDNLSQLLMQSESKLKIVQREKGQAEDSWLDQQHDLEQTERRVAGCMSALRQFCPKLETVQDMVRFYDTVMPALDRDGFQLYFTAVEMTGFKVHHAFPYEDVRGVFEDADGHELMAYLLADQFHGVDWDIVSGTSYESASLKEIDTATPEYQAFAKELYGKTLRKMGFGDLMPPEPVPEQSKEKTHTQERR